MRPRFITKPVFILGILGVVLASAAFYKFGESIWSPIYQRTMGKRTVAEAVELYGPRAHSVWAERLRSHQIEYPPHALTLVALKQERKLEVWARTGETLVRIAEYPILAASGRSGPKLREGDNQVPEGFYAIEGLNPNSSYHLSMKVAYPNEFDRARGKEEGRSNLGGDIFIHGKNVSIGCIAIGDPAIEELFVLVADSGHENTRVIISPCDFRAGCEPPSAEPAWTSGLYGQIRSELAKYTAKAN